MKNHNLALSLLIGAALTIPTLAMAAPANTKAANKTTATAEMAVASTDNQNDANTSKTSKVAPLTISETKTVSRARANSSDGQQPMTTEIKAPNGQQPMTTEIKAPAEALQNSELQTTEIISEDPVLEAPEDLAEASEEDDL